jgi:hypothetical protein
VYHISFFPGVNLPDTVSHLAGDMGAFNVGVNVKESLTFGLSTSAKVASEHQCHLRQHLLLSPTGQNFVRMPESMLCLGPGK